MVPRIAAYHPEIAVRRATGEIVVIKPDLDNWYDEREVLTILGRAVGVRTMGQLVEALMSGKRVGNTAGPLFSVRIEKGDGRHPRYHWSSQI
jgi:hypothetical protein